MRKIDSPRDDMPIERIVIKEEPVKKFIEPTSTKRQSCPEGPPIFRKRPIALMLSESRPKVLKRAITSDLLNFALSQRSF